MEVAAETASPGKTGRRGLLLGFALVVMTILAYWPAIQEGGFIWDDDDYVTENKTLRDFDGLKDIWMSPKATPQYYPLVHTGFWMEYQLWGLDPTGYHVTNVLLHALAALILWRLLRWLSVPGAWLAAALFALHPVHVESVAWITERKNVLSGVFYLGAALVYLKWADAKAAGQRRPWAYFGALLLFLCALLSKTVTVSLPAALLLVMWWREGRDGNLEKAEESPVRWWVGRIQPLVPFFIIGLAFSFMTIWLEKHHVGAKGVEWDLSFIERCLIAGRALWFYIGKLIWPVGLCFSYTRWAIDDGVWWQYLYPLAFGSLVILLWAWRKRLGRGPLVAMLFFAGSLFPALGFFDVYPMRYSFVADHFQYLASIGVLVLVASGIACCGERLVPAIAKLPASGGRTWQVVRHSVSAILLLAMIMVSAGQCRIYQNLETLWLDTIAKNPISWMAYNNLGQFYVHENRHEQAVPLLEKAILHNPRELGAINNLGVALGRLGRVDEAKECYQQAIAADPLDPQAYHNLGVALAQERRMEEALAHYRKALEINSELAATHSNLGMVLAQMGRLEEALPHHKKALAIDPETGLFQMSYADALLAAGHVREAADHYRTAISLDPSLSGAHYQLGRIAMADQLLPAALDHFRRAVKMEPVFALAKIQLASALAQMGSIAEAEEHFTEGVALEPESGPIRLDYASYLARYGDKSAACEQFEVAARLMPNNPEPLFQAGRLWQELGNPVSAEECFRRALQIDPNNTPTLSGMAYLQAGRGKLADAVALLQRATTVDPGNAVYHNNLGVMLVRSGDHAAGLKALEEAIRLAPGYADARKNLDDLRRLMNPAANP